MERLIIDGNLFKEEFLDDIVVELKTRSYFRTMKLKYKYTKLGFIYESLYKNSNTYLLSLIKRFEKRYNEKLEIKILEKEHNEH